MSITNIEATTHSVTESTNQSIQDKLDIKRAHPAYILSDEAQKLVTDWLRGRNQGNCFMHC